MEDGFEEFSDDDIFSLAPVKIKLLFSEFCPPDAEGTQQMICASRENDSVLLEEQLRSPQDPNVEDVDGNTPLHHGARNGHIKAVQLLLEASAEKDGGGRADGITPLFIAVELAIWTLCPCWLKLAPTKRRPVTMESQLEGHGSC